jgi:hypothetical protein
MAPDLLRQATSSFGIFGSDFITPISPEVVEVLLKHYVKASRKQNLRSEIRFIWEVALGDAIRCLNFPSSCENLARMILRMKVMVQYGADADFLLSAKTEEEPSVVLPRPCTVADIVKIGFAPKIPKEAAEFEKFLNSMKIEEIEPPDPPKKRDPKKRGFWRRLVPSSE